MDMMGEGIAGEFEPMAATMLMGPELVMETAGVVSFPDIGGPDFGVGGESGRGTGRIALIGEFGEVALTANGAWNEHD